MKNCGWMIASVILGFAFTGCGSAEPTAPAAGGAQQDAEVNVAVEDPEATILAARDDLFGRLSKRLMDVMTSGGPAAAIEVCSDEAPKIASAVGKEHGVAIGRTSFKLRNPKNAPPDWTRDWVEQRTENPVFVDLPDNRTGAVLPIRLKSQCLMCHGSQEQIADDVSAKLAQLYPDDQATGFKEGDLRGWFWVTVRGRRPAQTGEAPDASAATGGASLDELRTFAKFDAVYIPALALTKQEQARPAGFAVKRLMQWWESNSAAMQSALAADQAWSQDLSDIGSAIDTAHRQVQADELIEAHETLEMIRDRMMNARRRQSVAYELDAISDFHSTMEAIVKPAMSWTPESLTDSDIAQVRELCQVADEKWKVAEATEFDTARFGISASQAETLSQLIQGERDAIKQLQAALAGEDRVALISAARGLKPPFAKVYMFFGAFPVPNELQ